MITTREDYKKTLSRVNINALDNLPEELLQRQKCHTHDRHYVHQQSNVRAVLNSYDFLTGFE